MSATGCDLEVGIDVSTARPVPYPLVSVTLIKLKRIGLLTQAHYWQSKHRRAAMRSHRAELEHSQAFEQAALRESALGGDLEAAQAKTHHLQLRVFGR